MVSQATRAYLSSAMMASRTASEIWSAILSGCPSDTDSEVNRLYSLISGNNPHTGVRSSRGDAGLIRFGLNKPHILTSAQGLCITSGSILAEFFVTTA